MSIDSNAKPITRYQNFLAAIAGDENAKTLKPITRKENILASAAGNPDAKDIEPLSYDEYYLKRALEAGGGGSQTDMKTFIYNLSVDMQTEEASITIDESSPVPTAADFEHPERNQVKLVGANVFSEVGLGYFVVFLPYSGLLSLSITGDDPNYRYARTWALGNSLLNFAVQFYIDQEAVEATVYIAFPQS